MADSTKLSDVEKGFTNAAANIGLGPNAVPSSNSITPISSGPPPLTSIDSSASGSGSASASGFKDFLESNNLVAKIAFLLLVILIFIVILQLCVKLLVYFFDNSTAPYLINGMIQGNQPVVFPQDPSIANAKPLQRSINGPDGIEFTWSVWVYIENLPTDKTKYAHIFNKGNADIDPNGLVQPNNAPGLYISPGTNELVILMNTFDTINNEIEIPNIPLNKWINVIIRCQNTTINVYINGTIAKSIDLGYVPKQNYGDVYVGLNGGFDGFVSNLRYYNYALGTSAIQSITQVGPNIKNVDNSPGSGMSSKYSKYFSLSWYFSNL